MKVTIIRNDSGDMGTFGVLIMPGFTCQTGELPWRDNKPNISRIPAGTYRAKIFDSPTFGRVYKLEGTEPRTFILIHAGNYCGDESKDYRSDVEGCILLGEKRGWLNEQKVVLNSRKTLDKFMEITKEEDLIIHIEDNY